MRSMSDLIWASAAHSRTRAMSICSSNPEMFSASVPCSRLSSCATRAIWLRLADADAAP
jgi:hypothetical protein